MHEVKINCDLSDAIVYPAGPQQQIAGHRKPPDSMPRVSFILPDGTTSDVDARTGDSVMETAIDNNIPGIIAECGGACSCATCHVYVDEGWLGKLPEADALEDGMLECALERQPNSRLSCQLRIRDDLDGIVIRVPEAQI